MNEFRWSPLVQFVCSKFLLQMFTWNLLIFGYLTSEASFPPPIYLLTIEHTRKQSETEEEEEEEEETWEGSGLMNDSLAVSCFLGHRSEPESLFASCSQV